MMDLFRFNDQNNRNRIEILPTLVATLPINTRQSATAVILINQLAYLVGRGPRKSKWLSHAICCSLLRCYKTQNSHNHCDCSFIGHQQWPATVQWNQPWTPVSACCAVFFLFFSSSITIANDRPSFLLYSTNSYSEKTIDEKGGFLKFTGLWFLCIFSAQWRTCVK